MQGIVALMHWIYRNLFKCIYVKNQKLFVIILMHFSNLHKILNIFLKTV